MNLLAIYTTRWSTSSVPPNGCLPRQQEERERRLRVQEGFQGFHYADVATRVVGLGGTWYGDSNYPITPDNLGTLEAHMGAELAAQIMAEWGQR